MCSLWQDSGGSSFIKMLTRPHRQWMHCSSCCPLHAELCFSCCFPLSFSCRLFLCPLHLPLYLLKTSISLDCRWNRQPTNTDPIFFVVVLPSAFFSLTLFCVSFFFLFCSTVVTVSVLFSFNLNTFQLCMNQALINLIMFRHANVTKLPLCYIMCVCHIETFHMFMWGG